MTTHDLDRGLYLGGGLVEYLCRRCEETFLIPDPNLPPSGPCPTPENTDHKQSCMAKRFDEGICTCRPESADQRDTP